jgi:TatD DNase family protein
VETDSPFLTPVPFRGKKNEPAHVALVAQKVAELRGLPVEALAAITTGNTRRFFRLPPIG